MKKILAFCVFAALAALPAAALAADTVRIHGATTTAELIVNKYKAAVEKATGYKIEALANRAGPGLIDLSEGRCDLAVSAAGMTNTFESAKNSGRALEPSEYPMFVIRNDVIVFAVDRANPVKKLTKDQLSSIFSGLTANWKDVGGKDQPIVVLTHGVNTATRAAIKDFLLHDGDFSPEARVAANQDRIAEEVSRTPGAIAGISKDMLKAKVRVLETEQIFRPLAFFTKGAPDAKLRKVIDAYRAAVAKDAGK